MQHHGVSTMDIYKVFFEYSFNPFLRIIFVLNSLKFYLSLGRYFGYYSNYPLDWYKTPQFILGSYIFFLGMIINIHSDHILRNLRKPNEKSYKIPYGGFFKYVSCKYITLFQSMIPNYLTIFLF